jgi:hypothetical protein
MKPLKIAPIFLALLPLICCLTCIIVLSRNISRLRNDSRELRAQLEALQETRKTDEEMQRRRQPIKSERSIEDHERYETEHRELLRLRNELSKLRRENNESSRFAELNKGVLAAVEKAYVRSELAYTGPWLGIGIRGAEELTNPILRQGVIVTQINARSPSGRQLEVGDIIFGLNDTTFAGTAEFKNLVSVQESGLPIVLSIYRRGESMNVSVTPGERTGHSARASNPYE